MGNLAHTIGKGGIFGGATRALWGRLAGAFVAFAVALVAFAVLSGSAQAASFTVDDLGDSTDATLGNGSCADASGKCTLRAAIGEANALAGNDEISFAQGLSGEISLVNGELIIYGRHNLTITGPGRDKLTVSGGGKSRVFTVWYVQNDVTAVTISDLTIAEGYSDGYGGGGVRSEIPSLTLRNTTLRDNNAPSEGGGIYVTSVSNTFTAKTRLENSTLSGNHAMHRGGGIHNRGGDLTVRNSTLSDNTTGSGGDGGAIGSEAGTVNVQNSTLSGNRGTFFGGIDNDKYVSTDHLGRTIANHYGSLMVQNSTITNNEGFDVRNAGGNTAEVGNSIIATGGSANDVAGAFTSRGHNLIGAVDGSTGFTNEVNGDKTGTQAAPLDPRLGPLADNGGPTKTHALLSDSPAIGAGDTAFTPAPPLEFDQRGEGFPRKQGEHLDIGAFEVQPPNAPPVAESLTAATNEDAATTITLAATDADGDDLNFEVVDGPTNGTLSAVGAPTCTGTAPKECSAEITYTPNEDFNGTDSFTYKAGDGRDPSSVVPVDLTVNALNDAPGFELSADPDQQVDEDAGAQTVSNFATNISAGPSNESGQAVDFDVTNDNSALFSGQPEISSDGTLTYAPAADANGTATVTVVARDDGGTDNGGDDTSDGQAFTITVTPVAEQDTTAPKVASTTPTKNTGVSRSRPGITATFSEKVDKATVVTTPFATNPLAGTSKNVKLINTATKKQVAARVSCDADPCNKVTITPKKALAANRKYKATVTAGVKDLTGNALNQNPTKTGNQAKTWTFTTRG